jgi:hypothetical protein
MKIGISELNQTCPGQLFLKPSACMRYPSFQLLAQRWLRPACVRATSSFASEFPCQKRKQAMFLG